MIHPPLIRAIAHTNLHVLAYGSSVDHLLAHGIKAYIGRCTARGEMVWIDSKHPFTIEEGRKIVQLHVDCFDRVLSDSSVTTAEFCRTILDADDVVLGWWCEHKFGPVAMEIAP